MDASEIKLTVEDEQKPVKQSVATNDLWSERKRLWCGLPWTFTKYILRDDRLLIRTGFLNQREDEVRLYRIRDISITKSLMQRIFGLGTINIVSDDKSMLNFSLENIKDSYNRKEQLTRLVEKARERKRASIREVSNFETDDGDLNSGEND